MKKNQSTSKTFKKIFSWILWGLAILIIGRSVISTIDRYSGYRVPFVYFRESVVLTNSMENVHPDNDEFLKGHDDRISPYDLVCHNRNFTFETLEIYDIILYRLEIDGQTTLICHRIVDKFIDDEGNKKVVTKGDANSNIDGAIAYEDIVGKVYLVIPKVGYVFDFLFNPYGALAIFGTASSIFAGILIADGLKNKKSEANTMETED